MRVGERSSRLCTSCRATNCYLAPLTRENALPQFAGVLSAPDSPVDIARPQRPAALKHRGVPIGNGHQRFGQRHQAGPAMAGTFWGARLGDTHAAAPRDGVTTLRWPGVPGRLPRWRTLADIDGGRSAGPPPRRTRVNPRCGENTSRLDTESSSIGQSVDDFSAGQIRNGTGHCAGRRPQRQPAWCAARSLCAAGSPRNANPSWLALLRSSSSAPSTEFRSQLSHYSARWLIPRSPACSSARPH